MSYIFPPENKVFFELLEKNAEVCRECAETFVSLVSGGAAGNSFDDIRTLKHESDKNFHEIIYKLNEVFITPMEPEQIHKISVDLNKITKRIARVCRHLEVYHIGKYPDMMIKQAENLLTAVREMQGEINKINGNSDLKYFTDSNMKMKEIESFGDELYYNAMQDLYSGSYAALDVIKLKSLYGYLEEAMDSCFSVSDRLLSVVLGQN